MAWDGYGYLSLLKLMLSLHCWKSLPLLCWNYRSFSSAETTVSSPLLKLPLPLLWWNYRSLFSAEAIAPSPVLKLPLPLLCWNYRSLSSAETTATSSLLKLSLHLHCWNYRHLSFLKNNRYFISAETTALPLLWWNYRYHSSTEATLPQPLPLLWMATQSPLYGPYQRDVFNLFRPFHLSVSKMRSPSPPPPFPICCR